MSNFRRWFRLVVWVEPVKMPPGYESEPLWKRLTAFIGFRGRF